MKCAGKREIHATRSVANVQVLAAGMNPPLRGYFHRIENPEGFRRLG